jgi:hypothetical protein
VLASLLAQIDDPEGVPNLVALLETSDKDDPDGTIRFNALANLGALGDPRAEAGRSGSFRAGRIRPRAVAAIALQRIPGDAGLAALRAALEDPAFECARTPRWRSRPAAIRPAPPLERPSRAGRLREGARPRCREVRRGGPGQRGAGGRDRGLARLRRPEDQAAVVALAEKDGDLAVREGGDEGARGLALGRRKRLARKQLGTRGHSTSRARARRSGKAANSSALENANRARGPQIHADCIGTHQPVTDTVETKKAPEEAAGDDRGKILVRAPLGRGLEARLLLHDRALLDRVHRRERGVRRR